MGLAKLLESMTACMQNTCNKKLMQNNFIDATECVRTIAHFILLLGGQLCRKGTVEKSLFKSN